MVAHIAAAAASAAMSPLAIPAAIFGAYLDARYNLSGDLSLISNLAKAKIRTLINERKDRMNAFYALEEGAQENPTRPLLWFEGKEYTYAEAYELTLRYAAWLKERFGVKKGDVVALVFMNKPQFLWLWWGLWALGAYPSFINYNLRGQALVHCVKVCGASLAFVDGEVNTSQGMEKSMKQEIEEGITDQNVQAVVMDEGTVGVVSTWKAQRPDDEARSGPTQSDMAMLIYTSGTTGLPKPAIVSWWKATGAAKFAGGWMGIKPTDRYYTCMPVYHSSAALLCLMASLQSRCTICLGRKFSAKSFFAEASKSDATVIQYVGETCRYLLASPPSEYDRNHKVRMAFGNGLRGDVWKEFRERFGISTIAEFYAATEGTSGSFNYNTNDFGIGAIGKHGAIINAILGRGQAIVKVDHDTETVWRDPKTGYCEMLPIGEPGELLYRLDENDTGALFKGYYKNNKATEGKILRNVFKKGDAWFRTGDVISRTSEGLMFFNDRIGDTYRWKSENVSTTEVSNTLNTHPQILDSAVYGVPLPKHDGNCGVGAIQLQTSSSSNTDLQPLMDDIYSHISKSLPKYAIPLFLRVVPEVERTGNNKVMKAGFRKTGVNPESVKKDEEGRGWRSEGTLWWLKGGRYVPFTKGDWEGIEGGRVKL